MTKRNRLAALFVLDRRSLRLREILDFCNNLRWFS